ncbi:hypothetical protein OOK27_22235 [Streptomyces canus]|uniref:hypothetical protein n=1 Tax=Streptomyces canus TaxID=58343 RepID=UPI00224EAB0D|nr:hypothetical protein [Streptomyces canus]MCX5256819.1 hypothetical protein [Streptomyces canus]
MLDWSSLDPSLVPVAHHPKGSVFADPANAPQLQGPTVTETAIELPYRLLLSPHPGSGWAHSLGPVTHEGLTELWHTRLGVRQTRAEGKPLVDEDQAEGRHVRAVFSPDLGGSPPGITTSLDPKDRSDIVRLSADFTLRKDGVAYRPDPVEIDRLMLSSRGGWLRARGEWAGPPSFDLSQWQHVATQGRDQFVRVVREGCLFPFGHRAAHVEVTERVVEDAPGKERIAGLRKHHFILVREPEKTYDPAEFPHGGREMPFRSVRITTLFTPTAEPEDLTDRGAFWVMKEPPSQSVPVPFHIVGTDVVGERADFDAALIFVPQSLVEHGDIFLSLVSRAYQEDDGGPLGQRRRIPVAGARVAFAPPTDPASPGETTLATEALTFDVHLDSAGRPTDDRLPFLPTLHEAQVRLPAVEQIVGGSQPVQIALSEVFLNAGDDELNNRAQLFATVTGPALNVGLPADRGGALAKPDLAVRGLSRTLGPVGGDLAQLTAGVFDPEAFFTDSAKLLGAVPLSALVSADFGSDQFPKMFSRTTATSVVTTLDWEPKVTRDEEAIRPLRPRDPGISFSLHARLERPLDGSSTRSSVTTSLRNFTFSFLDVLDVHFDALSFQSENGGKPDVSAELAPEGVVFQPPLSFLNTLRRFIPGDGFSDPPALDISPSGMKVGYSLALPPVAVGVFELQNVKLGASLHLPFTDGRASLRFNFAERHDEFLLAVQGLGGGGFFTMALGLDGIEMIEAALEFGASVSLDFGVASGSVTIMAGVYFRHELLDAGTVPVKEKTKLTGYVRLNGVVEVLGLVSVSVELFMGLTYETGPERLEGVATLVIKIDLTLFSESVELTVRRSFDKGAGDPAFGDVMTGQDWSKYAGALA